MLEEQEHYCWLQQDGATCHTSNDTIEMLSEFFHNRLISK
uniref:Transposase n=1 Tax=Cyriopagopus schmidti TaxID=29017 RepID=B5M6G0_CYRSC|nr:transposase [Cyriopagopus schmidti]